MSESIPIAKRPPRSPRAQPRNSKRFNTLMTAIVPALVTIAVSFIAIVPQLRRGDAKEIVELSQLNQQLKERQSNAPISIPVSSDKKLSVSGTVRSEDGREPLSGVEVYLIPLSTSPMIATTKNPSGSFTFKQIPFGAYQIVVREPKLGKSGSALLLPDQDGEVPVKGARVTYQIEK